MTFVSEDREGRSTVVIVRKTQLALNGNMMSQAESGHMMIPFTAEILSDEFYPDTADMMQIIRAD